VPAAGERVAAIRGVAMAMPGRLVANDEIAARIGVDEQWIAKRTGTAQRPWAVEGERLSEFAARAASAALARAELDARDLDLVLVVGADFLSRFLDYSDRSTAPLFADGAGAAVVSSAPASEGGVGPVLLYADHSGADLIRLERGERISMKGQETFRAAVSRLSDVTVEALAASGVELRDIDLFVYHQANSRIIRAVGQRLRLETGRVADYVDRFANSSTATLPIALSVAEAEGRLSPGDKVLLASFGGGFTWGATVVQWA